MIMSYEMYWSLLILHQKFNSLNKPLYTISPVISTADPSIIYQIKLFSYFFPFLLFPLPFSCPAQWISFPVSFCQYISCKQVYRSYERFVLSNRFYSWWSTPAGQKLAAFSVLTGSVLAAIYQVNILKEIGSFPFWKLIESCFVLTLH